MSCRLVERAALSTANRLAIQKVPADPPLDFIRRLRAHHRPPPLHSKLHVAVEFLLPSAPPFRLASSSSKGASHEAKQARVFLTAAISPRQSHVHALMWHCSPLPRSHYRSLASILVSINLLSSYPSKPSIRPSHCFHSRARITPACPALPSWW